jgi:hypothetical protein
MELFFTQMLIVSALVVISVGVVLYDIYFRNR